ncbi:ribosome silencing factor [Gordonia sp. PDNC005]|uniref:ribosome silencing factor n=1 Tax=unclassified Gordonia (in: high G+C Gram-positive bacteria) TaxID=2657482 RepID=UPI0019642933|nr:ribosome silencing factor [Gordonia sp. PDNC005]QRY61070.1 ribosome silencing factor [Gordonia sp. PDNC005]
MSVSAESLEMTTIAAHAAVERLATNVAAIDVSEHLVITDVFLICSADNERQVNSIVEEIEDKLREAGHQPLRREGTREGRWALLDYGDIVVHVQHDDERDFYGLERLWKDCPLLELEGVEPATRPEPGKDDDAVLPAE